MLNREEKALIVAGLTERFRKSRVSLFTDIRGISVAKLGALRRELKTIGAELKVAKKTLLARALGSLGIGIEPKALAGEIGVVFGYEDQVLPAKAAVRFSKENETFKVLKGILGSRVLETGEVLALAKLPGRQELLSALARTLQAPLRNLANALEGNFRNLVVVLSRLKGKK